MNIPILAHHHAHLYRYAIVGALGALAGMLLLLAFASPALAQSTSSVATEDYYMREYNPQRQSGTEQVLEVDGSDANSKDRYALLRFDDASIPAGATLTDADVTIQVTNHSGGAAYEVYALLRNWAEKGTWNATGASAQRQKAGARGANDASTTVLSTLKPSATGSYSFDMPNSVVDGWLKGSSPNGIIIRDATVADGLDFRSSEYPTVAHRPTLVLTYTTAAKTGQPETTIDSGPSGTVASSEQTFTFSSAAESDATFACRMDGGDFSRCTSPKRYTGLPEASHTFEVRATDAAGNTDPTPASRTFTVDLPDTTDPWEPPGTSPSCTGVDVTAAQNLSAVAANHAAGTTFCIHDGSHTVSQPILFQTGDRFVGVYSDGSGPVISWGPSTTGPGQHVFRSSGSERAHFEGLEITGAIHDDSCEPDCGRAISGGEDLHLKNVYLHHNENAGVGGAGAGLIIEASNISENGSIDAARDGGKVSAAGVKVVESARITNSLFHNNVWVGIWCDVDCDNLQVEGNTITDNGKAGISYELTTGEAQKAANGNGLNSYIANNTITSNGDCPPSVCGTNNHSGILINTGQELTIRNNTIDGQLEAAPDGEEGYAIFTVQSRREVTDDEPGRFIDGNKNIRIRDNSFGGDPLKICTTYPTADCGVVENSGNTP